MNSPTKASVVIPSRGGAERLPRLFECLRAQTHPNWEAIVVLDGDIDHSEQVVAQYADLPVRAIVFPENRGRVAALNAGFSDASGEVFIRCDDDLAPASDYIARHVAHHSAGQPVGVVGLYRNVYPTTPFAQSYGRETDLAFRREAYQMPSDNRWRYWAGNVSVSRTTYEQVGPYDVAYRAYGWEDVDWGYRLAQVGIPIVLDPALETDHHIAATTTEIRTKRAFHSGAARHIFESKHGVLDLPVNDPTWWNKVVALMGRQLDSVQVRKVSRAVDKVLPLCPRPVGKKAVALLVESAALAGYGRPQETSTDF